MINPNDLIDEQGFDPDELSEVLYAAVDALSKMTSKEARYISSELESMAIQSENHVNNEKV